MREADTLRLATQLLVCDGLSGCLQGLDNFFDPKHPLEAAAMDGKPEGTLELRQQIAGAPVGPLASAPFEMRLDLRRQFVALTRALLDPPQSATTVHVPKPEFAVINPLVHQLPPLTRSG